MILIYILTAFYLMISIEGEQERLNMGLYIHIILWLG